MMAIRVSAIAVVVTFAVLMAAPAAAQGVPSEVSGRITLVESADAPGHIGEDRLARVYWDLIREQKLSLKQLPAVLVFHVSRKAAASVGLVASGLRTDKREQGVEEGYYQLWLVGEPVTADYVLSLQTALEHEFGLQYAEKERQALLMRVALRDMATIDAKSLTRGSGSH